MNSIFSFPVVLNCSNKLILRLKNCSTYAKATTTRQNISLKNKNRETKPTLTKKIRR